MAKQITPLTDTKIKNAKPKEKAYTMADGGGMHLEVKTNGTKAWRFRYKFQGINKKVSLGIYPDVPLVEARKKRDIARTILATTNDDPFAKKEKEHNTVHKTFKEWAEYYLDKVHDEVSYSHYKRTVQGLNKDVYPAIGDMFINDIRPKHIIEILHSMAERDAKTSAKKVLSSIGRVYQVSIANFPDEVEFNPCASVNFSDVVGKIKETHYPVITEHSELAALLSNIDDYSGDTSTRLALKMLAHVFTRPTNVRLAHWEEIDLKAKRWTIPAHKMKTANDLIVPLSNQVIQILEEAKKYAEDSGLVFPSPKSKTQALSDGALLGGLRRMGYTKDEIVAHSFRGIFSTIAHEMAVYSHDIIETQLAHSVGSNVSKSYNRAQHLEERTKMMQWWSDYLVEVQNESF